MSADDRKFRLMELAAFCAGFVPAPIPACPEPEDARKLIDDLCIIAERFDRVIAAYGDYTQSVLGRIDRKPFTYQVSAALEGNALYEIESAAEALGECAEDDAAETQREMRRA